MVANDKEIMDAIRCKMDSYYKDGQFDKLHDFSEKFLSTEIWRNKYNKELEKKIRTDIRKWGSGLLYF